MKFLRKYAANNIEKNSSFRFRENRIKLFKKLLGNLKSDSAKVVDIGGSSIFWNYWMNYIHKISDITLINISYDEIKGYKGVVGDASNLAFIKDSKFDILFSNSFIEHLSEFEKQNNFAKEINRIANFYFIQTPAFLFPLEPHFLFPIFHWLPKRIRAILHQKFNLGWYKAQPNILKAKMHIDEIRIMKKKELKSIFPNSKIFVEKFLFIPKSYIITNMVEKFDV